MRPLLSLCMIVKDEAASIKEVLEAVEPFIDRWTILDSGSADGTQDIVKEALKHVPGRVVEEGWNGYAANRNRVLELDRESLDDVTEFQLMLSGDEFVRDGESLRDYLETQRTTATSTTSGATTSSVDCHFIQLTLDDVMMPTPRVFRTGSKWVYDDFDCGVHEVPVHADGLNAPVGLVPGAHIEHIVSDPIKRLDSIWETHIPLLEAALVRNPKNPRALEYLAQSYEGLFAYMEEAERKESAALCLDLYHRRFELPFSCDEERRVFSMRYLDDARFTDVYTPEQLFELCDKLHKEDPKRPEPALMRAVVASTKKSSAADVYTMAAEAAKIAAENPQVANSSPLTMSCAWKAHRLAAVAAKQLSTGTNGSEWLAKSKEHVSAGLGSGGPWALFKGIADAPVAVPGDDTLVSPTTTDVLGIQVPIHTLEEH